MRKICIYFYLCMELDSQYLVALLSERYWAETSASPGWNTQQSLIESPFHCNNTSVLSNNYAKRNPLLDKVRCAVIEDFQKYQHHLMLKQAQYETIYGHKKKVCLEQNISIGSHCMEQDHFMLHFTTFHNVSIYVKWPQKLVMIAWFFAGCYVNDNSKTLELPQRFRFLKVNCLFKVRSAHLKKCSTISGLNDTLQTVYMLWKQFAIQLSVEIKMIETLLDIMGGYSSWVEAS